MTRRCRANFNSSQTTPDPSHGDLPAATSISNRLKKLRLVLKLNQSSKRSLSASSQKPPSRQRRSTGQRRLRTSLSLISRSQATKKPRNLRSVICSAYQLFRRDFTVYTLPKASNLSLVRFTPRCVPSQRQGSHMTFPKTPRSCTVLPHPSTRSLFSEKSAKRSVSKCSSIKGALLPCQTTYQKY